MSATVVCPRQPLTRDLDVTVSISRPQTEIATDLTLLCFITPDAPFSTDQGRVRYYSSMTDLEADFAAGTQTWFAGNAFFSQTPHPSTMAVGAVFTTPTGARLYSGDTIITQLKTVSQGAFEITVGGTAYQFTNVNFTTINTISDVVNILQAAFTAQNVPAKVSVWSEAGILITTTDTGSAASISFATSPTLSSGTPSSPATYSTYTGGVTLGAQLPQGLYSYELQRINTGSTLFSTLRYIVGTTTYGPMPLTGTTTDISTTANYVAALNRQAQSVSAPVSWALTASGIVTCAITTAGANNDFTISVNSSGMTILNASHTSPDDTTWYEVLGLTASKGGTYTSGTDAVAGTQPDVDISSTLGLSGASNARITPGTAPESLVQEAQNVETASRCNGRPIYGWCLDAQYRETQAAQDFAAWVESRIGIFSACTNSIYAFDGSSTTDFGAVMHSNGYRRTCTIYHDNPQVYPDVSYLAYLLATNYSQPDSAITMKFKQLPGIATSRMTETMLTILNGKRINCYTQIGTTSQTVREGVQAADTWFSDSIVNLDNFREELQVAIYNVFLRNKKVPYTSAGQNFLISAAMQICSRYTLNGVFADRSVEDASNELGFVVYPATDIVAGNIALATTSDRAQRLAPPIHIIAYEAGAFHRVTVNVDVYN